MIEDTSKMMLSKDVVISYGDLYAEGDSALIEKPTVTVFGARKIVFQMKNIATGEHTDTLVYNKDEGTLQTN